MTFVKWLKQYEKSDTPIGDLARDMIQEKRDRLWAKKRGEEYRPYGIQASYKAWRNSYRWILRHLEELHACSAAIKTFKRAWAQYETTVSVKRNKKNEKV